MIFLVLFAVIVIIVIALNIYDNFNLQKIENYYLKKKCLNVTYSKGIYKGICQDLIVKIPNSFSPDLQNDRQILKISEINEVKKENLMIIINKDYKIPFAKKENLNKFYESIEEKIN